MEGSHKNNNIKGLHMNRPAVRLVVLLIASLSLSACDWWGSDNDSAGDTALDTELRAELAMTGHTGNPGEELPPVQPAADPLVKLGQVLFFSRTLSGSYDVACATCHHPDLAGADGLSLAVGIASNDPSLLGPGRRVDPARDRDPRKDCINSNSYCGPNVPRNSQTTFNVALYQNKLFFDGRVEWLDKAAGQIRSAESGIAEETMAGDSLVNAQSRLPVPNANEMRGFRHIDYADPNDYRTMIVNRLKGIELDGLDRVSTADAARWLQLFRTAFDDPSGDADTLVTYPHVQRALDAFQRSTTFTDTPWARYVAREGGLPEQTRRGALLFFRSVEDGGFGCAGCHSGDHFSDERFHNTGFPQIGRGKRPDGQDRGREDVTRNPDDSFAYRTPALINIALTAPYGHAGTFDTLEELIAYHVNPSLAKAQTALAALDQFSGINTATLYPNFDTYTSDALASPNFNAAGRLAMRDASTEEIAQLKAFLLALTDDCAADIECVQPWVPQRINGELATGDDPDGNLLVVGELSEPDIDGADPAPASTDSYPVTPVVLAFPETTTLTTFAELENCGGTVNGSVSNSGLSVFSESAATRGLDFVHAYSVQTWLADGFSNSIEDTIMAGGLSSAHVNDDCWPDLIVPAGEPDGLLVYFGSEGGTYTRDDLTSLELGGRSNGVGLVDINGDYRREIFVANLVGGPSVFRILGEDGDGDYALLASLPMFRNTWGMAFGDTNGDSWPEMFLTHWDQIGLPNIAPAMWRNNSGVSIRPYDLESRTGVLAGINQTWQFAPGFADFNDDGHTDLVVASDFGTSTVFQNNGTGAFINATDNAVITDQNGMGSAIGDYDNDGDLDWFVSSVYDPNGVAEIVWGVTGNRLYRNVSSGGNILFQNVTEDAGVADGLWGWAACFADFNNDGWLDIFHENGFGYIPPDLITQPGATDLISATQFNSLLNVITNATQEFSSTPARLFMNNGASVGGNTFTESAASWGVGSNTNGRGVVCDDLDRDGDIDLAVLQNSGSPKLYINQSGSGAGHRFLDVRVVGASPNTEALGTKVRVSADTNGSGSIGSGETQLRVASANNNFNSQNLPDLHFGLGAASVVATLDIEWPDGTTTQCTNVPVNRFVVVDQRSPGCP
ncbi:MAG: FG-GAP-like repeat-containing protein [Pseudomonadota bacterium]